MRAPGLAIRIALAALTLAAAVCAGGAEGNERPDGEGGVSLDAWKAEEGTWDFEDGRALATGAFARLMSAEDCEDFEVSAAVEYRHDEAHAAAGVLFRIDERGAGYAVGLREVEKGVHPEHGAWERPVIQLYRIGPEGWTLLQESLASGCRAGVPQRLKIACKGEGIFVFHEDMETPVLRARDERRERGGRVGLWKDTRGEAEFGNVVVGAAGELPAPPVERDWSDVRGAIYVRSNAVNAVEMWHDYWPHTDVLDRELELAAFYGFNMVQVYLHWIVWNRHGEEYLTRVEDFLARAARHGLRVNFILWDDCGHVEPALEFGASVPGRHNSQMMPNPSHRIRDSEAELAAHESRFREYVEGMAGRFKDDPRIAFWEIYNEAMGPKERVRDGEADQNIQRLQRWTRDWIKGTGTAIPVTATGGAFHGPKVSDFYSYHSYANPGGSLPNAGGGPGRLCTETLNRPNADLGKVLAEIAGSGNGFVVWELMIGRDNCRFPWGHPDGLNEPAVPFHGVVYPDGHPWSVEEVRALLSEEAFRTTERRAFRVEYFDGEFEASRKVSLTPWIDFDLGDEPGTGSPDASTGIGHDNFSIRWAATFEVEQSGGYVFRAASDGRVRVWIDDRAVLDTADGESEGGIRLDAGVTHRIRVDYVHCKGEARARLAWSGPGVVDRLFRPVDGDAPLRVVD